MSLPVKMCHCLLAWRSDWLIFLCRNIGLHWWERLSSLLLILVPRREMARPGQQALGEETHHSRGERTFKLLKQTDSVGLSKTLKQYFLWQRSFYFYFCSTYLYHILEKSNCQNFSLRGAVVSSTFAILSQYWLTVLRQQNLNTSVDSWWLWCMRFFCPQVSIEWCMLRIEKHQQKLKNIILTLLFTWMSLPFSNLKFAISPLSFLWLHVTAFSFFYSCLRWSWLPWSYWRIWLLEVEPPPCSLWSCRCHLKRWWKCADKLCCAFTNPLSNTFFIHNLTVESQS